MPSSASRLFNALIRTHHITSRKKVAALKKAASSCKCRALIWTGGSPGIMYVEGSRSGVEQWVATVQVGKFASFDHCYVNILRQLLTIDQKLRYKDYQLVARPALVQLEQNTSHELRSEVVFDEVSSVKEFACKMSEKGAMVWWKRAMGYNNG